MSIKWININFKIKEKKINNKNDYIYKNILKNLNGEIKIGNMIAIMGPSGAGKSSLLNILSGFNKNFDGELLYYNDNNIAKYKKNVGYVHQSDLFKENLTVFEHLYFISNLKEINDDQNINKILYDLNLEKVKDSNIKNLSGGEKKRLSIASELISNPKILFLDEPTSGLDSFMAKNLINCLNNIKNDMMIILTIHQPSLYIYHIFDKIYLLKDGKLIYNDTPNNSYDYFIELGYQCPKNENIAEYILEIVGNNQLDEYNISDNDNEHYDIENNINNNLLITNTENEVKDVSEFKFFKSYKKINLLFQRNNKHFYRDPFLFKSQIFKNLFMIIIIGLLYFQLENNEDSVQSISGVLYFILINQCFNTIFPTIKAFSDDIQLFKRENNVLYNLFEYYFSKVNGDIMFQILTPLFLYIPIYFMVGLRNNFITFLLSSTVMVLSCLAATSLGYLFGSVVNNIDVGLTLMNIVILPLMIGGGFFINVDSIPIYLIWLKYISFFKYAFENMMILEWEGKNIDCNENCYLTNGDEVLEFYNIDKRYFRINFLILLLFSIFFRFITYFILKYKVKNMYV